MSTNYSLIWNVVFKKSRNCEKAIILMTSGPNWALTNYFDFVSSILTLKITVSGLLKPHFSITLFIYFKNPLILTLKITVFGLFKPYFHNSSFGYPFQILEHLFKFWKPLFKFYCWTSMASTIPVWWGPYRYGPAGSSSRLILGEYIPIMKFWSLSKKAMAHFRSFL